MIIKNYNDFVNENIFTKFIGKALNSLGDLVSKPLNNFMKNISNEEDPGKIIKGLKTYVKINLEEISNQLKNLKDEKEYRKFLIDFLLGLYTAIKGVEKTQKVNKVYFDEIFKNADKNLIKVMNQNEKNVYNSIENYVDNFLIPNLKKSGGIKDVKESYLFEDQEEKIDKEIKDTQKEIEKTQKDNTQEEKKDKIPSNIDKLKEITRKWMNNILSPIMKLKQPKDETNTKDETNNNFIIDKDGKKINRKTVQNFVKDIGKDNLKKVRNKFGDKKQYPL